MRQFLLFFRQFPKPLANSNTCIFVNIAWKMNCDILKFKLILCEWNAFYFIEITFIDFTSDEIKQCIVFFGTPGIQLVMYGRETRDLIQINFIILNVEPNVLAIVFSVCICKYNIAIDNL